MKIVMYTAGLPFNGDTLRTKSLGGSETAAYSIAKELSKRGHNVFMFTNIKEEESGIFEGVSYLPIGPVNDQFQLGATFMDYAMNVPSDVMIGQRVPSFFYFPWNSKVNLWHTHDLGLRRNSNAIGAQLWNLDKVLCVSDFHKKQVQDVYGLHDRIMDVLPNGVDLSQFTENVDPQSRINSKTLVYTSRPERGLEALVKPDGIMEQLFKVDPEIKLTVCGYDNTTPQVEQFYKYLWSRCEALPNVENFGALSKEQLYQVMQSSWIHVYPTAFEEVSCITAMEEQAAGTPFLTTATAALPETLKDAGVKWIEKPEDFTKEILNIQEHPDLWKDLHEKALSKKDDYSWEKSVDQLENTIEQTFQEKTANKNTLAKHFIYNSDIHAFKELEKAGKLDEKTSDFVEKEFDPILNGTAQAFYDNIADYNTNQISNNHNLGDDQVHLSMPRMGIILKMLQTLEPGSTVLDYGCCVGQFTIAAARAFPHLIFTGVEIANEQVKIGNGYIKKNNVRNAKLINVATPENVDGQFDFVYCSEVLEHTKSPSDIITGLEKKAKDGAQILFTVPSGPHELVRWNEQKTREHVHHFEDYDIQDMVGFKEGFNCIYGISPTKSKYEDKLGHYSFYWTRNEDRDGCGLIDYDRKFNHASPLQTLSVCMITKPDGAALAKTLDSIKDIADEIIIGVDGPENQGRAWEIGIEYGANVFKINSPIAIGFDEARNATVEKASSDWILWIDDDETMQWSCRLKKFLRNNQYDSYAIHQHHFSAEPASVIKTDLPCRVFRNNIGIKFYGVVHEHPETAVNEGAGKTFLIPQNEIAICHNGYDTEETRRKRFERNFPLMLRDREKYPDRYLGQFLWIRDLLHLNRFEQMQTGQVTPTMFDRATEALSFWRKLIEAKQIRMAKDALQYTTEAVDLLTHGHGIDFELGIGANQLGIGDHLNGAQTPSIRAKFLNKEDIALFTDTIVNDKIESITGNYL